MIYCVVRDSGSQAAGVKSEKAVSPDAQCIMPFPLKLSFGPQTMTQMITGFPRRDITNQKGLLGVVKDRCHFSSLDPLVSRGDTHQGTEILASTLLSLA